MIMIGLLVFGCRHLPKVGNLDCLMVAKQIFWLQISVQVVVLMHV